jgi:hypothetical protein
MRPWQNNLGAATIFGVCLAVSWLMVHALHMGWDRSLLIQIMWIVCVTRWHQPNITEHP